MTKHIGAQCWPKISVVFTQPLRDFWWVCGFTLLLLFFSNTASVCF